MIMLSQKHTIEVRNIARRKFTVDNKIMIIEEVDNGYDLPLLGHYK